ncbi:MAG: hypothetical protein Kow00121_30280 [Elainellaceae cyanobacterium]
MLLAGGALLIIAAYIARCPLFGICSPSPELTYTVSVYQYTATIPVWRYLYSANELSQAETDGWLSEGVVFLAFKQFQPETVPVYRYVATDPWRYQLSTKAAIGQGWTNEGVAFYAYAQPKDKIVGLQEPTQPIYQYYAVQDGKWRYLYSPDANVGNGWKNTGPAFHALVKTK